MKRTVLTLLSLIFCIAIAIAQDNPTPTSIYNEGLAALKAKDYTKAYDLMIKAVDSADPEADAKVLSLANKNGAIAAYYHGSGLYKEKNYDAALAVHDKGITMNSGFYGNYIGKGKIFNKQNKVNDAVSAYMEAAKIRADAGKADKAQGYIGKAENIIAIAYSKKMSEEAMTACQTLLAGSASAEGHYYMAKLLMDKGSKTEGLNHAMKAAEIGTNSKESKYTFLLGEAYEANGKQSKAMENYNKVGAGKYYEMAQYKINHKSR